MYQLEVKLHLVKHQFPPSEGWEVTVDVDAMERAKGNQHKPDKRGRVEDAEQELVNLGATVAAHPTFGRVDIVAKHPIHGCYLIEVEGQSSKQKEQALYSALGQSILMMGDLPNNTSYGLAVPDAPEWERQVVKIPDRIKKMLNLRVYLVSMDGVREI